MELFGIHIPVPVLDWSGAVMVVISLYYLWHKRQAYWHWSNASLVPYFALFMVTDQLMLAGLQVSYLLFGVHGLILWRLERRRRDEGRGFAQGPWYGLGWALSLGIFAYTAYVTQFSDIWAWVQFAIVAASLLANLATTRMWLWSWYLWVAVNAGQAVYFWHLGLMGQFALQFVLGAMSIEGARRWHKQRKLGMPGPGTGKNRGMPGEVGEMEQDLSETMVGGEERDA